MVQQAQAARRAPLSRDRVLRAAVALADTAGIESVNMRGLAAELGVVPMALYKHVANKEEILDGIVELVVGEIEIPSEGADWKEAMRRRTVSAREVLSRHSWAIGLLEARGSRGPTARRYLDAILRNLRSAGFSIENAVHAFWVLDCYVYGHVIQETSLAFNSSEELTDSAGFDEYPHLVEIAQPARRSAYSFDNEFEFGLDLILDALERAAT